MKFVLVIELGNDAMQTGWDVAATLRRVASQMDHGDELTGENSDVDLREHAIYDLNGNNVGSYAVKDGVFYLSNPLTRPSGD